MVLNIFLWFGANLSFAVAAPNIARISLLRVSRTDSVPGGETLYNGIRIPALWPPASEDPLSKAPMKVPYLEHLPAVIPIDVGRQLFVDDFLIERTNLLRVFHQPKKYSGNPVLSPVTRYEISEHMDGSQDAVCYLGHGGVFFDPKDEVFKMFYTAGWRGGLALATSQDLVHWKRPSLGLAGGNLILPRGALFAGGDNAVWLDLNTKDSMARYKFMAERNYNGSWASLYAEEKNIPSHTLQVSPDGRIWSAAVGVEGKASDYCSFFYNPFRNVWVYSIKENGPRGRCRYYLESPEFLQGNDWRKAVYWVNADSLDTPDPAIGDETQLYSLNAVAYESLLLGEFYIYEGPANKVAAQRKTPKITEIKLGFSRDGFHWSRPDRRAFIPASRTNGAWDKGYIHGTTGVCLVMGDELWFPYTGYSGVSPNGSRGMYVGASIGMAVLRRDGFASMKAVRGTGTLTTRPVTFTGSHLFVNVDCPAGSLRVEVLDEKGKVIPSFSREKCISIRTNSTIQEVGWKGGGDLFRLAGRRVRFRFYLTQGDLYAFWVSATDQGASGGYVGAGGPGFGGVVDTAGRQAY